MAPPPGEAISLINQSLSNFLSICFDQKVKDIEKYLTLGVSFK